MSGHVRWERFVTRREVVAITTWNEWDTSNRAMTWRVNWKPRVTSPRARSRRNSNGWCWTQWYTGHSHAWGPMGLQWHVGKTAEKGYAAIHSGIGHGNIEAAIHLLTRLRQQRTGEDAWPEWTGNTFLNETFPTLMATKFVSRKSWQHQWVERTGISHKPYSFFCVSRPIHADLRGDLIPHLEFACSCSVVTEKVTTTGWIDQPL